MAASSIAKMAVQLVANSSGFAAGLMPGRSAIKHMQSDLHSLRNSARVAFAGFGAYIGLGALRGVASRIYEISDSIQGVVRQAEKMGIAPDAFRALDYAAIQSDMSIGEIAVPMNMLLKNLSGVGEESAKAERALNFLGVSARDIRSAGADKALVLIAQGMDQYESSFTRAGILASLFGKQWQGVYPLVTQGADSLKSLLAEGHRLGGMITPEDMRIAADYNDAIKKLKFVWEGFKVKAVSIITPDLIKKADEFSEKMLTVGPDFWGQVKTKFMEIVSVTETLVDKWKAIAEFAVLAYSTVKGAGIGAALGGGPGGALAGGALAYGATSIAMGEAKDPGRIKSIWSGVREWLRDQDRETAYMWDRFVDKSKWALEQFLAGIAGMATGKYTPSASDLLRRERIAKYEYEHSKDTSGVSWAKAPYSIEHRRRGAKGMFQDRTPMSDWFGMKEEREQREQRDRDNQEAQRLIELAGNLKDKLRSPFEGLKSTVADFTAMGKIEGIGLSAGQLSAGRSAAIHDYVESLKGLSDESLSAQERLGLLKSTVSDLTGLLESGSILWDEYSKGVAQANASFAASFKSMREYLTTPEEKMQEKMDTLDFMFKNGMISADKYQYGQQKLWEELSGGADKYAERVGDVGNAFEDAKQKYLELARAVTGGQEVQSFGQIRQMGAVGLWGGGGGRRPFDINPLDSGGRGAMYGAAGATNQTGTSQTDNRMVQLLEQIARNTARDRLVPAGVAL